MKSSPEGLQRPPREILDLGLHEGVVEEREERVVLGTHGPADPDRSAGGVVSVEVSARTTSLPRSLPAGSETAWRTVRAWSPGTAVSWRLRRTVDREQSRALDRDGRGEHVIRSVRRGGDVQVLAEGHVDGAAIAAGVAVLRHAEDGQGALLQPREQAQPRRKISPSMSMTPAERSATASLTASKSKEKVTVRVRS